jgi:hypothetical protein
MICIPSCPLYGEISIEKPALLVGQPPSVSSTTFSAKSPFTGVGDSGDEETCNSARFILHFSNARDFSVLTSAIANLGADCPFALLEYGSSPLESLS